MAKYPYIVVKDNVWYPAGAEVPADKPLEEVAEVQAEKPKRSKKK